MKSGRLLLFCVNRATTTRVTSKSIHPFNSFRLFSSSSDSSSEQQHEDYLKQLQELNDEREQLFGFTQEEQEAWKSPQVHSSTLLDAVQQARQELDSPNLKEDDDDHADYRQESAIESESAFPPHSSLLSTLQNTNEHRFTHVNKEHTGVHMVNVGDKLVTQRRAKACSRVVFPPLVMTALFATTKSGDFVGPKGPIFETAKIAGIMAAKYVMVHCVLYCIVVFVKEFCSLTIAILLFYIILHSS